MTYDSLIALLGGVIAVPVIDFLKKVLKVQDFLGWVVACAVYSVLAIVALLVSGQTSFTDFTWVNFPNVVLVVLGTAQAIYQARKARK